MKASAAGDGLGVMMGGGLACYDLDGVVTSGSPAVWAREFVSRIRERIIWVELSQSGRGLHVFVESDAARGWRRNGVEFYPRGRFILVTGKRFAI